MSGPPAIGGADHSTSATVKDATDGSAGPENISKGKRKVTFDVKPDIVTIKREVEAEKKAEEAENAGRNSGG
jgi:DNA-binding transcriptional regulator GbsR (MarR family)